MGPGLIIEVENALKYGENMMADWMTRRMLSGQANAQQEAEDSARFFRDAALHKSHGRRIDRDEARAHDLIVEDLEADEELQDAVLTAYHIATMVFEKEPAAKMVVSGERRSWVKNWVGN